MAITWKLLKCQLGNDDNLTLSVQGVTGQKLDPRTAEQVNVGKIYSVRFHKKHPKAVFLAALKEQIKADRAKAQAESVIGDTIDLSGFETFINS